MNTLMLNVFFVIQILLIIFEKVNMESIKKCNRNFKKKLKFEYNFSKGKKKVFNSENDSYLFPSLKAIMHDNIPVPKKVSELKKDYDEDILGRNKVYIIKNNEIPGWDGMKIPIYEFKDKTGLRLKPPKEKKAISIFTPVLIERFILFATEECLLPSRFFLQVAFCTFDSFYPYLEGVPTGETMQDIIGAAMFSINKIKSNFAFDLEFCKEAILMIPDSRVNFDSYSICHEISLCMHQNLMPELSPSLSILDFEQLIKKSFMLHGLEDHLKMNTSLESLLWNIIKKTHKQIKWKNHNNPNRLFTIIRAYILTLYIKHSSLIIPGWHVYKYPSASSSLSFVYVKSMKYTDQTLYRAYCARKLKKWLSVFQPKSFSLLPNVDIKEEVAQSACFQAARAGFVSNEKFDFSNLVEEGIQNIDLINLQLPILLIKSDRIIQYIRNYNLRNPEEKRWTHYYNSYHPIDTQKTNLYSRTKESNLQNLETSNLNKQNKNFREDLIINEIKQLIERKNSNEPNI